MRFFSLLFSIIYTTLVVCAEVSFVDEEELRKIFPEIIGDDVCLTIEAGKTYFIRSSPDLVNWEYVGTVKRGATGDIYEYSLDRSKDMGFIDYVVAYTNPDSPDDIDLDGFPDELEVTLPQEVSNLFKKDTDNNGIDDGDEDPDGDGIPNKLDSSPLLANRPDIIFQGKGITKREHSSFNPETFTFTNINSYTYFDTSTKTIDATQDTTIMTSDLGSWVNLDLSLIKSTNPPDAENQYMAFDVTHTQYADFKIKNVGGTSLEPIEERFLITDYTSNQETTRIETLTIPVGSTESNVISLRPATLHVESLTHLSIESAPEVLAVNSDFDEGRIDPNTGYAIPDCDDIPNVNPETGSGNSMIGLNVVKDHIENTAIKKETIVVDDLHEGWFGIPPNSVNDAFWDGATVTIKKISNVDSETGYAESGQVRFYAKWGANNAEYYGIEPYNLETLEAVNLVSSGINGISGGVYGSSSPIPSNATFYMEGVRSGKITLEWKYVKDDVTITREENFLVATQQSPEEWKASLAYKIKLETSNDPSGIIDISIPPTADMGYWERMERLSECYDYYQECFMTDQDFLWAGLGRLAANQVVAGLSDSEYGRLVAYVASVFTSSYAIGLVSDFVISELQQTLFSGGFDIFDSIGWQHYAYRSSGILAMEYLASNYRTQDILQMEPSWGTLEQGKKLKSNSELNDAAYIMTNHEQNTVIVPTYTILAKNAFEFADDVFSLLSQNPSKPSGEVFRKAVVGGNLANTEDRWRWIDNKSDSPVDGNILQTWEDLPIETKKSLVGATSKADCQNRFSFLKFLPVKVNDDLDLK